MVALQEAGGEFRTFVTSKVFNSCFRLYRDVTCAASRVEQFQLVTTARAIQAVLISEDSLSGAAQLLERNQRLPLQPDVWPLKGPEEFRPRTTKQVHSYSVWWAWRPLRGLRREPRPRPRPRHHFWHLHWWRIWHRHHFFFLGGGGSFPPNFAT